jgi:mono/diheme cytochrome c family protein
MPPATALPFAAAAAYACAKAVEVGRKKKMRRAWLLLLFLIALPQAAPAQDYPRDAALNETQRLGRQLFAQSCGVCHLPPVINARTFGPILTKDTAGGNDEVIRGVINDGTPRMPGFKHNFGRAQIDAIIAYMKTVPTPPPAPATQTR